MDLISVAKSGIRAPDYESIVIFSSIVLYSVIATIVIPGKWFLGAKLKDGKQLPYKLNGTWVHLSAIVLFVLASFVFKLFNATILYDHYGALLTTDLLFTVGLTLFLYVRSLVWIPTEQQNFHYPKWNVPMNLWVGTELNPHFFGFEIKLFAYRPGFILLSLLNVSSLAVQYERYGTISTPMILFQLISLWYSIDCFWFESGLVYMFDIIEENFGFMLVMGDYVWIPYVFSLQSLYLIDSANIPAWYAVLTVLVFFVGFYIFRQANYQKFAFRQNPNVYIWGKPAKSLETKRGTKLMISGWWGVARKINYLGDIMIALSMSMPCGFAYVLPWLYPIYLTILLIHRAKRDNDRCAVKYGEDWNRYCKQVPYMIVPYVY